MQVTEIDTTVYIIYALLALVVVLAILLFRNSKKYMGARDQTNTGNEKNQELEEQINALKEVSEEKNNIMGIVSHDLKAPLNRIFALSNLIYLSDSNLNDEQKGYLDKMNQVVKEGLNLIRNMLDIRALEHKGIKMKIEKIDLTKLFLQMVKTYKSLAAQKQIEIKFIGEKTPLVFESDKQYLFRIFENLISNAIKFSPQNREIRIVLSKQDEKVIVKVEDDGWGISEDDQKKLFQKFVILSSKPTGGESSSGLGLSIAKNFVDLLSGQIYYELGKNDGSTFVVELPLVSDS